MKERVLTFISVFFLLFPTGGCHFKQGDTPLCKDTAIHGTSSLNDATVSLDDQDSSLFSNDIVKILRLSQADSLLQMGLTMLDSFDDDAMLLLDSAAAIRISQGKYSLTLADSYFFLGNCYSDLSNVFICDYSKAIYYLQQSLFIRERLLGSKHRSVAECLRRISYCYAHMGGETDDTYKNAVLFYNKALSIDPEADDETNWALYTLWRDRGDYYYIDREDYNKAADCYLQSLQFLEKSYGKETREYAMGLADIGTCFKRLVDNDKALDYYLESLSIYEMNSDDDGLWGQDYAILLGNIARLYSVSGRFDKALDYFLRSLNVTERVIGFGSNSLKYADRLWGIGDCYYKLGDYAGAEVFLSDFAIRGGNLIPSTFSTMTESERSSFWDIYSDFYTNSLFDYCTTIGSTKMECAAYNGALLGKGLLLNAEIEMRKLIMESGDEEALRMYNDLQESRKKLDKLYENPIGRKDAIDSLNKDIESSQRELIKRSKAFGNYTRNLALKWTDVQSALGRKDIAIEFETYTHQDTTFYIALTLRSGYTEPHLVELFNSKDLEDVNTNRYYSSTSMTDLVWGNLSGELNGVKNVFFSPAGKLNNIGIEYLIDKVEGHLMSDKRNYYRLTSTRELAKKQRVKKMTYASLYGGIRYDISPSSNLTGEETESERLVRTAPRLCVPMDSLSISRGGWAYLPGTKEEAESISSTLSSRKVRNDLYEGETATEESFKALSGAKNDVIHIATHGFYWAETEAASSGMKTSSFMLDGESKAPKEDKSLTRSGLLFAGAQNAFEGKDIPMDVEDGILTAKDISRMDLRGTDLVVISACQSGLGEVTGDGVFGLQRGFKKAGVQSIVMSLWEVSDDAAKIMMTRFYENLAKGKSKNESFQEAQKYLRKYEGGLYDEPEYYAAFVLLDAIR